METSRHDFKLVDAFPSESVLARWILALSCVTNDLLTVNSLMVESFEKDINNLHEQGKRMYYFKLACAHFNEAIKLLRNGDGEKSQDIKGFLNELSFQNVDALDVINHYKQSWDNENGFPFVVKAVRDEAFHYHFDKTEDILDTIYSETPDYSTFLLVGNFKDTRFIFADDVFINKFKQMVDKVGMSLSEAMQKMSSLITSMVSVTDEIISAYISQKTIP